MVDKDLAVTIQKYNYQVKEEQKKQAERPEGICSYAGDPPFQGSQYMRICNATFSHSSCPMSCWNNSQVFSSCFLRGRI